MNSINNVQQLAGGFNTPRRFRALLLSLLTLFLTVSCQDSQSPLTVDRPTDDGAAAIITQEQTPEENGGENIDSAPQPSEISDLVLPATSVAKRGDCFTAHIDWPLYTVAAGDTLVSIAYNTGSSLEQLLQVNCLSSSDAIRLGEQLLVPSYPLVPTTTLTHPPPQQIRLEIEPALWFDPTSGYMLEAGKPVEISWSTSGSLSPDRNLEIDYQADDQASQSIVVIPNVSDSVSVLWNVPVWASGSIVATLSPNEPGNGDSEIQRVLIRSRGLPGCYFTPYGIGGDVPLYNAADIDSPVVGYTSPGLEYQVIDAGGHWRVEGNRYSGQYYQIQLEDDVTGWVQDYRGGIEGACAPFILHADIEFFEASPQTIWAGETVVLRWSASGKAAEICPVARYTYFTTEDCQSIPLSGSLNFTTPADLDPAFAPGFRLRVDGVEGTESQEVYVYVNLYCDESWFFDPEQPVGPVCPQPQIISTAAIQHFERGTMIWLEELGRYYIFSPLPFSQTPLRRHESFAQVDDPVTIIDDTSGNYNAPDEFYAPESGFGYLWRGDVAEIGPLHESLGWATAPEYGYEATFQCSDFISTQVGFTCYLDGPDGELIWIDSTQRKWLRSR